MQEVFCLEELYLLYEPDVKEGRYILEQIIAGGNFGYHDARLKISKNHGKLLTKY